MTDLGRSTLLRDIETLRQSVLKASVLNAKLLRESAEYHVARIAAQIPPSPALDEMSFRAVSDVIVLTRVLYGQADVAESEAARKAALAALDGLSRLIGSFPAAAPGREEGRASA